MDDDAPLDVLAPLGRGFQTGFGTVWNILDPAPGSTLAVFGVGAVGLAAVMAAASLPLSAVITVDKVPERLELARELGATHTINAGTDDATAALAKAMSGCGLGSAIDTTTVPAVVRTAIDALGGRGTCAVVGAPPLGTEASFDVQGILPGKRIVGVTLGDGEPETTLPQLVALHRAGKLSLEKLIRYYELDDLDAAVADMYHGRTIKPVIRFDD